MRADTQRWLDFANTDLAMARIAFDHGFHNQTVFHCQQALEKALKAIWIERVEMGMPPKTHELPRLARDLRLGLTEADLRFLQALYEQYLPSHYADFEVEYPAEVADYYLERTTAIHTWLLQQLS